MTDYEDFESLAAAYGSPFYLFDRDALIANYGEIRKAFSSRYSRFIIGYSYKTNYLPHLCRTIRELGGYAEVVSRLEYDLALAVGQDPEKIIFNGPLKSDDDLAQALRFGSIVNLDGFNELEKVQRITAANPDSPVRIGLRINMNLTDPKGGSHIQEGLPSGRFGFPLDVLEGVDTVLRKNPNIRIHSLHGHTSSSSRAVWIYEHISRTLVALAADRFPECDYINIGGGIFGEIPPGLGLHDTPSFDDYAEAVCAPLRESSWAAERTPWLVLEPGVAMAANTLSYVTRVIETKRVDGRRLAVVDGSALHIKPSLHRRNQPFRLIKKEAIRKGSEEQTVSVTGATCMEKDYLLNDVAMEPERGDFLRFDNVGAYSIVMSPPFIFPAPAILIRERENRFRPVRLRQRFHDLFRNYSDVDLSPTGEGGAS